jgi:hypothetical protein
MREFELLSDNSEWINKHPRYELGDGNWRQYPVYFIRNNLIFKAGWNSHVRFSSVMCLTNMLVSEGEMCWEGNRKEILHAENQKLQKFVFANKQYQKIRDDKINDL